MPAHQTTVAEGIISPEANVTPELSMATQLIQLAGSAHSTPQSRETTAKH